MYPYDIFPDFDFYILMILVGILAAMVMFRVLMTRTGAAAKVFNLALITAIVAIVVGYLSAVLFQSFYNHAATGEWKWGEGATFYGGLIGAAVSFLLIYFIAGHFLFKDKAHIREFNTVLSCAMPCIVLAHAFGRIGCLFAGCCHGIETDSWIGITMYSSDDGAWHKFVPVQLFESLFLFALFGLLAYLLLKRKNEYIASIYLIAYGVWRFAIEYLRGDESRGSSGISWLTPSQLTAIILVLLGVALIFLYKHLLKRTFAKFGVKEHTASEKDDGEFKKS